MASSPMTSRSLNAGLTTEVSKFFANCLEAYQVFSALGVLTEDLRVLSFNAEFASGRAGAKGNCVRVLTQATRELVNNLSTLFSNIETLEARSYQHAAEAMDTFRRREGVAKAMEVRSRTRSSNVDGGGFSAETVTMLRGALQQEMKKGGDQVRHMVTSTEQLAANSEKISAIAQECDAIAVAIAVEAATAGEFQMEFEQVSETMHRYVTELQQMVGKVNRSVRAARETGNRLSNRISAE